MDKKIKIFIGIGILAIVCAGGFLGFIFFSKQKMQEKPAEVEKPVETITHDILPKTPPHPGKIIVHDLGNKTIREVPAEAAPLEERFVFLKNGKEVTYKDVYDEAIPILEIEIAALNESGTIVSFPKVTAEKIETKSYGSNKKLLRTVVTNITSTTPDPAITPPK